MVNLLIDGIAQIEALQNLGTTSASMTLPEALGDLAAGLTIGRTSMCRQ
jgi:hypothetical protein